MSSGYHKVALCERCLVAMVKPLTNVSWISLPVSSMNDATLPASADFSWLLAKKLSLPASVDRKSPSEGEGRFWFGIG